LLPQNLPGTRPQHIASKIGVYFTNKTHAPFSPYLTDEETKV
jgi:hypothetical protein